MDSPGAIFRTLCIRPIYAEILSSGEPLQRLSGRHVLALGDAEHFLGGHLGCSHKYLEYQKVLTATIFGTNFFRRSMETQVASRMESGKSKLPTGRARSKLVKGTLASHLRWANASPLSSFF
jgi:hypothetical protein